MLSLLLGVFAYTGYAQTHTMVNTMSDFVKGYSIEMCTDYTTSNGETVQAGTIYDYPSSGQTSVHFINAADDGTINYSKYITAPSGYDELRAVDIVGDEGGGWGAASGSAVYYITCLGRTSSNGDRVVIIPVDYKGDMVADAFVMYATVSGSASDDANFYPLHSIYSQSTGYVYVCGYYTPNSNGTGGTSLSGSGEPDFISDKFSFFMAAELSSGSWTSFNPAWGLNTHFPSASISQTYDYDIAMRMVELSNGDIFVTGSVNDVKHDGLNEYEHSATMNVVVDPNLTVSGMGGTYRVDHFTNGGESVFSGNEYGIGLVQVGASDNYIVGNYFYRLGDDDLFNDIEPAFFWVNWVDGSLAHTNTGDSRATFTGFDYAWALQTLDAPSTILKASNTNSNAARFLLPGMTNNQYCADPWDFSRDDIRAFMHDIEVDYNTTASGDIAAFHNRWTTYQTQNGTGTFSNSDSYANLGSGLSNIAWNPTFAARESTLEDIYLTAPTLRTGPDRLNIKNMRVEGPNGSFNYLEDANCTGSYESMDNPTGLCTLTPYAKESAYDLGYGTVTLTINSLSEGCSGVSGGSGVFDHAATTIPKSGAGSISVGSYSITQLDCAAGGGPYYKNGTTGIAEEHLRTNKTTIYPNPARRELHISLANSIDDMADIKVVMTNIYGQTVAELYNGTASGLIGSKALVLPQVANGLYTIQVVANSRLVHHEKLSIQQ